MQSFTYLWGLGKLAAQQDRQMTLPDEPQLQPTEPLSAVCTAELGYLLTYTEVTVFSCNYTIQKITTICLIVFFKLT